MTRLRTDLGEPTAHRARDVRALLGLDSLAARWIVAAYVTCMWAALLIVTEHQPLPLLGMTGALLALSAATFAIVMARGDPLPLRWAIPMGASTSVASALVLTTSSLDGPSTVFAWSHGNGLAVLSFMCVRGRAGIAWMAMVASLGVFAAVFAFQGRPALDGVLVGIINTGPLAMATVFAVTLRPSAALIYELRRTGAEQRADLAAQSSSMAERNRQLAELDRLARPLLERLATGATLTARDRETCGLLETHLRDRLRAPRLSTPEVADAARRARSRGVEVIMLDDAAAESVSPQALQRICRDMVDALNSPDAGDVRVRLMPPNRSSTASILISGGGEVVRREYAGDGSEVVGQDNSDSRERS